VAGRSSNTAHRWVVSLNGLSFNRNWHKRQTLFEPMFSNVERQQGLNKGRRVVLSAHEVPPRRPRVTSSTMGGTKRFSVSLSGMRPFIASPGRAWNRVE
jgi:hypothetical protein